MSLVLLTNVVEYTGPGALPVLVDDGRTVVCHDRSFSDRSGRVKFAEKNPKARVLAGQNAAAIYEETFATWGIPDAIVLNDAYPITRNDIEYIPMEDLRATFEAVVVFPVQLVQQFIPGMKQRRSGSFVFITSAREARPEPGFAVPTTARAATTAFAKALAKEVAPFGIQVNVVAPNYLYSEMYYPKARFVDSAEGRDLIARTVPFGRLGQPEEVGALIAFLASGKSPFMTGQVIHFTGGWS
jgi:NAD(P)-dependent dehydrogenase (short-subunit alcohol dehydrogenase family)